jgi:hypothetical protein
MVADVFGGRLAYSDSELAKSEFSASAVRVACLCNRRKAETARKGNGLRNRKSGKRVRKGAAIGFGPQTMTAGNDPPRVPIVCPREGRLAREYGVGTQRQVTVP